MPTIVKVQRPRIARQAWLVYNQTKSITQQIPDAEILPAIRIAMKDDVKAYFTAEPTFGGWKLGHRVGEQNW